MALRRLHYAWVVIAVTFLALLAAASVRAAPGVIIIPLEKEFGWDRASISLAVSISLITFGLGGPVGGTLVERFGPRRALLAGLASIALGLFLLVSLVALWQLYLVWGLLVGVGTGIASQVTGATVAHRWFRTHRGLVIGLFGAATSAGQLIFVPSMMALTERDGWRSGIFLLLGAAILVSVPVLVLMRDRPTDIGARPFGEGEVLSASEKAADVRTTPLSVAVRDRDFWLLAGSFFICGYTSNGLVGTHLIPHALEHGFTAVTSAAAVGVMGSMNIVGTLASGWLSDRYDNRKLLAAYYGFRAMSLFALPFIFEAQWLYVFAIAYGLDWIATVPPTANLVASIFGRASLGVIYGWVFFAHMCGAALAAYAGGYFHTVLGDYHLMFISAAFMGFIAVSLALRISPTSRARPQLSEAVAAAG
ncbi:MAG TPA: MFS transporter [Candidatus Limnocylindria bacterium]|nr:MFS transporter [Candidatus Limnocylindria bacterium]